MKEIEEKAKAYDEAIKQAEKELATCGDMNCDAARQIFRLFPELVESEDERIRKEIIDFLELPHPQFVGKRDHREEWIAWLEKQGEKNIVWSEEDKDNFTRVDYACLKVYGGDSYSSDWLRKFLGIHKKWRPSEKMLEALDIAIRTGIQLGSWEEKVLRELQKQLKAL